MKVTARGCLAAFLALQNHPRSSQKGKSGRKDSALKKQLGSMAGQAELTRKEEGMGFWGVSLIFQGLLIWCL